jgi:hypothetical protein
VWECLVCGLFCMATFCTVCVGTVWCVDSLVWLRSVQFVWEVSGVWTVLCGYVLYSLCASVWCVECCCGYGLCSLCREYLVCGLFGMATFCTVCVGSVWVCGLFAWLPSVQIVWGVSGVWTVLCGYGMYRFVGNVWCVDCVVWLRSVLFAWGESGVWTVWQRHQSLDVRNQFGLTKTSRTSESIFNIKRIFGTTILCSISNRNITSKSM